MLKRLKSKTRIALALSVLLVLLLSGLNFPYLMGVDPRPDNEPKSIVNEDLSTDQAAPEGVRQNHFDEGAEDVEGHTRGARGARGQEKEPNNRPDNATQVSKSSDTTIFGSISEENDKDWFFMRLDVYKDNPDSKDLKQYDRLSITHNSISGDAYHYLGIFVYGLVDINQNGIDDFDSELILMNCGVFEIGDPGPPGSEIITINAFRSWNYYFKIETDGGLANYNFRLTYSIQDTWDDDKNQGIEYASGTSAPMVQTVRMSNDTFDWFKEDKKIPTTAVGVNFSLTVEINSNGYYSKQPVTLENGTTIYFVTILHMLVYHEGIVIGNQPVFPYQYRDHIMTSKQIQTKLPKQIRYADVITLPTKPFRWTFYGFYVESYGIDPTRPGIKFYPLVPDMVDYIRNTFCQFTIQEKEVTTIERPELSKVSVISTSTHSIYGRTYDDYKYSLVYKQPDNNKPLITKISVFTINGEYKTNMIKNTVGTVADKIFEKGCEYIFSISGLELGEGDHHVFQFHFKDKNAWARGTIELGKSWHGPYISNNIPPVIRPSAPENITIYEDDNTTFFNLNDIFEDVDIKDKLNFTLSDPQDIAWSKRLSQSILDISIVNQSRLRIDPKPNQNGEVTILLNATDIQGYYSTYKFKIIIIPVNDPPQIIQYFGKIKLREDSAYTDINLGEYFIDIIDNDKLEFWAEQNINFNIQIDKNGNVIIKPKSNWFGTEFIDFYASDGLAEVSDFLKVIVTPKNDLPILKINDTIEVWEDNWLNFTINGTDLADNDTVIIGHNLTDIFTQLIYTPGNFGYSFDNYTGYLTFKPTNIMVGTYLWNISAVDENGALNFSHVTLKIWNVNDPPVPKIIYPESGSRFLTTDKISFRGTAYDPDNTLKDNRDFTWHSILGKKMEKIGAGRTLSPQLFENGTHKIILSVSDGMYVRNASITIKVFAINQNLDTDGDDIPDYWENLYYFNINDPNDAEDDFDRDTFSNWEEYKAETDPLDPDSMPNKHIIREKEEKGEDYSTSIGVFSGLIIVMIIIILYLFYQSRIKKRKKEKDKDYSTEGIIGMSPAGEDKRDGTGKIKMSKIICHSCGKSLDILTLNRPVVVTCTDCGKRGVVYK